MPSATAHTWAAELATKLIDQNGRPMQLLSFGNAGGDPWEPVPVGLNQPETTQQVVGVMLNYDRRQVDGTNVLATDFLVYLDSFNPVTSEMVLVSDGVRYQIVNVVESRPGLTLTHYELQVRV